MTVVISAANFNQEEQNAASINYKNNTGAAGASRTNAAEGAKTFAGVVVSKGDTAKNSDATYKSLLEEAEDVKEQLMASATTAKSSLKALFNKLSGAEAVRIDEDGFNLTSASTEDMVNIVEKIRIELAMHSDEYVPAGLPIDGDKIEQVTGSAAYANAVESKLGNAGITATEDNIEQVKEALEQAGKLTPMSEDVKNYMVANQIEPSIEGIYQAEHAVNVNAAGTKNAENDQNFEALRGQIEKLIAEAELPLNNQTLNNAKAFLQNNIPVTKENLIYKSQLDRIDLESMESDLKQEHVLDQIIANMQIGGSAGSTLLIDEKPVLSQVADVIDVLNKSDITTIEKVTELVKDENTFTINDLKEALQSQEQIEVPNQPNSENIGERTEKAVKSNYVVLQETRILMTAQAGVFLAKQGMNLYTTSVYEMAEQLKQYEQMNSIYNEFEDKSEVYNQIFQIRQAMYETAQAPEETIGKVLGQALAGFAYEERVTIAAFAQSGSNLRQQYERAGQTYDAVGTKVRTDLGDSLNKAVEASTASVLEDLNLENNRYNAAAVRILAANSMEITKESIEQVKELHQILNSLIDNMKPETVMSMIRDNVNPLTDDIRDVNAYLQEKNEEATEVNSEKYSRFLYKLENTEGISQEERKQFIGIYKMMNIFTKDAGNGIGALLKQGADVTMGNLMTAYESRRASGMDVTLDEQTGMAEITGSVNYFRTLFENTGKHITAHTLKAANESQPINDYSVENFCETIEENYDARIEAEALDGYVEQIKKSLETDARVLRQLEIADESVSINHIQAAENLLSANAFPIRRHKGLENGIEKIGQREELQKMYEELSEDAETQLKEILQSDENQTYEDINEARMRNHEIGLIKNLAIRNDYHIPIETETGQTMIHLTLVRDDEEQGKISIEMELREIGKISMEAKVNGSTAEIFVIQSQQTKTEEGTEVLNNRLNQLQTMLKDVFGMEQISVFQAESNQMPERFYPNAAKEPEKTETDKLYEIAQVMVKTLTFPTDMTDK